ncbi:hypothetical protein AB0L41_43915 [Amycolatopsis mediterranei]|uniref:hypothetical protein n=1 Tax=Amycolatopsis mediterranei TaxID=33910 RepID=UPI00343C1194
MLKILLTAGGLLFSVVGIYCAATAYFATYREHGAGPMWPAVERLLTKAKHWARRLVGRTHDVTVHAGVAEARVGVGIEATAVVTRGPAPAELPLDEQLRWIERRIELVELQAAQDREQHANESRALRASIEAAERLMREVDQAHRELTQSVAVGTVRRQIVGLALVGVGTFLLAIPGFLPA